jgi:hypothetical protein
MDYYCRGSVVFRKLGNLCVAFAVSLCVGGGDSLFCLLANSSGGTRSRVIASRNGRNSCGFGLLRQLFSNASYARERAELHSLRDVLLRDLWRERYRRSSANYCSAARTEVRNRCGGYGTGRSRLSRHWIGGQVSS